MGAFGLEFMFYVTGAIEMRCRRTGMSTSRNVHDDSENKAVEAKTLIEGAGALGRDSFSDTKIITIRRRA